MDKKIYFIVIIITALALIGGGCGRTKSTDTSMPVLEIGSPPSPQSSLPKVGEVKLNTTLLPAEDIQISVPEAPAPGGESDDCDALPDKLDLCAKYKCKFSHPFTGEILEKEVLGIVGGKCGYTEQMPSGMAMECKYTESNRKAVAQYYKDVAVAESIKTQAHIDLGSKEQKVTYIMDGKEVKNPLQEATNNRICVILMQ